MITIKKCREMSGLSVVTMANLLNVEVEEYKKYEDYDKDMPLSIGVAFSKIVQKPVDNIVFFNPLL